MEVRAAGRAARGAQAAQPEAQTGAQPEAQTGLLSESTPWSMGTDPSRGVSGASDGAGSRRGLVGSERDRSTFLPVHVERR